MKSWINLHQIIPEIRGSKIHVLRKPVKELTKSLEELGFRVYLIDGSRILNEPSFFDVVAQVLEFPPYFGNNWDAWNDSLGDFVHLSPKKVALTWEDADKTFANDPQTFLQAICDLYNLAASVALNSFTQKETEEKQIEVFILVHDRLELYDKVK